MTADLGLDSVFKARSDERQLLSPRVPEFQGSQVPIFPCKQVSVPLASQPNIPTQLIITKTPPLYKRKKPPEACPTVLTVQEEEICEKPSLCYQHGLATATMRFLTSPSNLWLWALVLFARRGSAQDNLAAASTEVCQSRTINYITHTLPQLCLRTSWSAANSTIHNGTDIATATATFTTTTTTTNPPDTVLETATATASSATEAAPADSSVESEPPVRQNATDKKEDGPGKKGGAKQEEEDDAEDLATGSFMSFEEWKAMMLKKSGQDLADLKERKHREGRDADPAANGGLETWGDDGEIALDFDVLSDKISEMTAPAGPRSTAPVTDGSSAEAQEPALYDDGVAHYRRPKDAGKTCKERFSYSSFDGGATVLKTSPGAKNAKAILVENKDSYMLFECKQDNKFVIVELSEDILVDTVVLANFEFFSSMIRSFRVSVSDKYPVKLEKWKDVGTFQARNSRDLQSFLIENPKIWAKYIRIEFLSHYGNEYYCPVSLLRVHGTRMLDSWKDAEAGAEEDEPAETITGPEAVPEQVIVQEETPSTTPEATHVEQSAPVVQNDSIPEHGLSPWYSPIFTSLALETCRIGTPTTTETIEVSPPVHGPNGSAPTVETAPSTKERTGSMATGESTASSTSVSSAKTASSADVPLNISTSYTSTMSTPSETDTVANMTKSTQKPTESKSSGSSMTPPKSSQASKATNSPSSKPPTSPQSPGQPSKANQSKNATSTASSASSSPTIQESFFKTVSKRLQFLESNTTLSLQYIEEQSRFLQEALKKMERRQLSRVDAFLNNLNNTVFSELRRVREDYDQIWQSTVIALETQREQSQRDILALRDEVRFQRHMAIFQAIMLLCCLMLVVLSRGVLGSTGVSTDQWSMATTPQFINSYLASPRWPPGSPRSASRSNTPVRNGSALRPDGAQARSRTRHGPATAMAFAAEKMLPMTPTSEGFDSNDNDTDTASPTPPRPITPRIRINEPEADRFLDRREGLGREGNCTAPTAPEETPPTLLGSRETTVEVEQVGRVDGQDTEEEDETRRRQFCTPPPTRSPLSGPGVEGSTRKPLPALPGQSGTRHGMVA